MTSHKLNEFKQSINRIYLFFAVLIQWIQSILRISSKNHSKPIKSVSLKDLYIERNTQKFLQTFQCDKIYDWNSNIDSVIKDTEKMTEIMADTNNFLEKKWQSRVLMENTPRGNVIMFYDIYKRGFSYYCDNAVMPYDIMNAVAMKYVLTFHCRDFFVDSNVLQQNKKQNVILEENREVKLDKIQSHNPKTIQDKHAFAKFKAYNTVTKKAGISAENDKTINCFLHLGGVRNWIPIPKKTKPNPINGFKTDAIPGASNKKLSYLEYKKQQMSSH